MAFLEERIAKILDLREQQKSDPEIAEALQLTLEDMRSYESYLIGEIETAFANDITSSWKIAHHIALPYRIIQRARTIYALSPPKPAPKIPLSQKIAHDWRSGMKNPKELAKKHSVSSSTVYKHLKDQGFQQPKKQHPEIDSIVPLGRASKEMAKIAGISRQAVTQYLKRSKKYEEWKQQRECQKRKEREEKRYAQTSLIQLLKEAALSHAQENGWPYRMAVQEWLNHYHGPRLPFGKLLNLFSSYQHAVEQQEKRSIGALANDAHLYSPEVSEILRRNNLPTLVQHHHPHRRYSKQGIKTGEQIYIGAVRGEENG